MRFIEKTDCKLSVSDGSVNALSTYKIKSVLLLTLSTDRNLFLAKNYITILQSSLNISPTRLPSLGLLL